MAAERMSFAPDHGFRISLASKAIDGIAVNMKSDLFALKDEALSKKSGGMMPELKLEFLAVCNDYTVLKTVTTAVQKLGGQLHCVPSIAAGNDYLERRKMDGIVIDAALTGVLELVKSIRDGRSNRQSCVFVCVEDRKDASSVITAGANFVFYKPLVEETLLQILHAAAPMMDAERRRYFRYEIAALVSLSVAGREHKAVLSNLSESGMAVRSLDRFPANASVDFAFELPRGPVVKGRGEVMWSNNAGTAGIRFHFLSETGQNELPQWLASFGNSLSRR